MNEAEARSAMLIRAIELADTAQAALPRETRQWASDLANKDVPRTQGRSRRAALREAGAFVARRASLACRRLESEHPEVSRVQSATRWPSWLWWLVPVLAFALGVASNELGPDRRINIISFPLLGVLAWNAAVYVVMLVSAASRAVRPRAEPRRGFFTRLHARLARRRAPAPADAGPLQRGLNRFVSDWLGASARLNGARARASLHLSAALLALGAVAGMYVRGLGFEYLAGWESTFLSAEAVHGLLAMVLGPASALAGIALPGPEHIASLRFTPLQPGEGAARWIHLYALTAALFVVLPRLALAAWNAFTVARLKHNFVLPLDEDRYFRRLVAMRSGEPTRVRVVPYSYTPEAAAQEGLRAALADAYEGPVEVEIEATIPYGDEDDYPIASVKEGAAADCVIVLFNMNATPEDEAHGALVARLRGGLALTQRLFAVLNESPYRRRLAGQPDAEARTAERRSTWESVLGRAGAPVLALDLEGGDVAATAKRIESTLHETAAPEAVS